MISRFRSSFAAKLLALELGSIVIVAVALAGVLVAVRITQTRELERNVAQANVSSLVGNLRRTGAAAMSLSGRLAAYQPLQKALGATPVTQKEIVVEEGILDSEATILDSTHTLVLLDPTGKALLARSGSLGSALAVKLDPSGYDNVGAIPALSQPGGVPQTGLMEANGNRLELDGIAAVQSGPRTVGYVVDSVDVKALLVGAAPPGSAVHYSIFFDGVRLAGTLPGATSSLPRQIGTAGSINTSFATYQVGGRTYFGYYELDPLNSHVLLAADLEDSVFAAQVLNDLLAAFFAVGILATVLGVLAVLFARNLALRPLQELIRGAAQLGAGDYDARVDVPSADELGHLARSFNAMAERITENTRQLEEQRGRLDANLTNLSAVSRALTTTTAGADALRDAVIGSVLEITGARAAAMYAGIDRLTLTAAQGVKVPSAQAATRLPAFRAALEQGGGAFNLADARDELVGWSGVVVPMLYHGRPVGAIAAFDDFAMDGADAPALFVLAAQAAVALENTELFQRERQTVVRLQELDAMKSDFLATIQHELRTPLTAIIGMTDLLEMAWPSYDEKQKMEMLGEVQLAAKGLYDVVETMLDYSMLESDRMRLSIHPAGLRPAVEAAVHDLEPTIRRQKATVTVSIPETMRVQADAHRLLQMVRALVDNAVKFGPQGGRVRVTAERQNGTVSLKVVDRGIGIAPEHQTRIFERFYQIDNTATRRHGGTGMGLALTSKLVSLHHGRLTVESTPGKGSTFTLVLPAAQETEGNGSAPRGAGRVAAGKAGI